MDKLNIMNYLSKYGIIAVVRTDSSDKLIRTVEAMAEGGVHCIEVTMTSPGALECIEAATHSLAGADVCIGVGSVLDAVSARLAIKAGAQYVVSPITSREVIEMAHLYGKPCMPGAFTPTEIYNAWLMGGDFIKVFPAGFGGLEYIKAVRAPLPQIPLVPTGGVDLSNLADFIKAGVTAIGVGGNLAGKKLIDAGDYKGLAENARRYADAFHAARSI